MELIRTGKKKLFGLWIPGVLDRRILFGILREALLILSSSPRLLGSIAKVMDGSGISTLSYVMYTYSFSFNCSFMLGEPNLKAKGEVELD